MQPPARATTDAQAKKQHICERRQAVDSTGGGGSADPGWWSCNHGDGEQHPTALRCAGPVLQPAHSGAGDGGNKCWRATATSVDGRLEPRRQVLEIRRGLLCSKQPQNLLPLFLFLLESAIFLLPRFSFAGTSGYQFAITMFGFCWNQLKFCYHVLFGRSSVPIFLLPPCSVFATTMFGFCYHVFVW